MVWTSKWAGLGAGAVLAWLFSVELGTSRRASRAASKSESPERVVDTTTTHIVDAAAAVAIFGGLAASLSSVPGLIKPRRPPLLIGLGLLMGSGILSSIARRHLGEFHRDSLTIHANHELVETGPYSLVRHPLYVATAGSFFGIGAVFGHWMSLGLASLPIMALVHRIGVEEEMLVDEFGQTYVQYQKRTAKLIPGIW